MSYAVPTIADAIVVSVASTETDFSTSMLADGKTLYQFCSSTACWIKQGKALLLTSATKANFADGDYFSLTLDGRAVTFEIDKTGDGLTAAGSYAGRTAIDVSAASTAAQCAAIIAAAIDAAFPATLTVTDNADGTVTLLAKKQLAATETVAHASFLIAASTLLAATAGSGSMFVPAGVVVVIDGRDGQTLSVIRDTADGKAHLVPFRSVR